MHTQDDPSKNSSTVRKIYFKEQKNVSIHYTREDAQSQQITLQNLKKVRKLDLICLDHLGYCQIHIFENSDPNHNHSTIMQSSTTTLLNHYLIDFFFNTERLFSRKT